MKENNITYTAKESANVRNIADHDSYNHHFKIGELTREDIALLMDSDVDEESITDYNEYDSFRHDVPMEENKINDLEAKYHELDKRIEVQGVVIESKIEQGFNNIRSDLIAIKSDMREDIGKMRTEYQREQAEIKTQNTMIFRLVAPIFLAGFLAIIGILFRYFFP
jgi:CHASE3 domain sensor protein